MSELKTPAEARAEMSRSLLVTMAASPDPTTRENAKIALDAQGLGLNGQPVTAPVTAAPTAPAPVFPAAAPVAAPVVTAPLPVASPATGPSDAALEGLRDANGLILGKFRTVTELRTSYFGGQNLISTLADENAKLKNQPVPVTPGPTTLPGSAPGDAPRVNPTARPYDFSNDIAELVKSSEESGSIDPVVLGNTVARIAAKQAQEALQAQLGPMQAINEAETYMRQTYPDSVNHGQEIQNFIKTDPTVGPTVAGMLRAGEFKGAMEYAWSMYTVRAGIAADRTIVANSQIAEEERARARSAAGFSGSPNTGVHAEVRAANTPLTREEIAALNEHSKLDQGQLRRRAMLGQFLPPEWRTWENPQGQ